MATNFSFKTAVMRIHNFVYRIFGIILFELDFDSTGSLRVSFSLQGLIASIFWFVLFFYCFLATNLENTTGITQVYHTSIALVGDFFHRLLNLVMLPAIFLPTWLCYSKRKLVIESIIVAELKLQRISVKDIHENWAITQHLGQIVVLFVCYAAYTISTAYLLQSMNVAVENGETDFRLIVTTYANFLYGFLFVIDLVSSISFVVRRLKVVQRKLSYLKSI